MVAADAPDAVVLDVRMPPTFTDEGLAAAEQIRDLDTGIAILVLSAYVDPSYASRLLRRGSRGLGLLSKDRVADLATLVDALDRLCCGGTVIDQDVVAHLFDRPRSSTALSSLTLRERDVLALMAEGRTNEAIAATLHLSERTVETYNTVIFDKLGIAPSREDNRRVRAVLTWLRGETPTG